MMEVLDGGAEDFESGDDYFEIMTEPSLFSTVREVLEQKEYRFVEAAIEMVPVTMTKLTDAKQMEFMDRLIESLEDLDDVQNVYHNWEQDEE